MKRVNLKLAPIASLIPAVIAFDTYLFAQNSAEGSYVHFYGRDRTNDLTSFSAIGTGDLITEPGTGNSTQFAGGGSVIESQSLDASQQRQISMEHRGNIGVTQNIKQISYVGASTGFIKNGSFSRWESADVGHWWNKATILTDLTYTHSVTNRDPRDFLDTDGLRVLVAPLATGESYALSVTWLASRNMMVLGGLTTTTSTDRPRAVTESLEGRYFINPSLTTLQLKASHYGDTTQVAKTTDFGQLTANEWETQLHQHVFERWIVTGMFRDHFETETPRSPASDIIHRHSRSLESRLRWRYVTGPVTEDVPELYTFAGTYQSYDQDITITHIGVGGKYAL